MRNAPYRLTEVLPAFEEFQRASDGGGAVPVRARVEPAPDPRSALFERDGELSNRAVLLESNGPVSSDIARYTIAASHPYRVVDDIDPATRLDEIDRELASRSVSHDSPQLPFVGGAIGYFSYDLGRRFENIPSLTTGDLGVEDFQIGFYESALVVDRLTGDATVVATVKPRSSAGETYDRACNAVRDRFERVVRARVDTRGFAATTPIAGDTAAEYRRKVESVKEFIRAGDIFQANLSQPFTSEFSGSVPALYNRLAKVSPASFSAFMAMSGFHIVSSSPERFLRVRKGRIETRPIKGTIERGRSSDDDRRRAERLLSDPKERAEHVMIVDLLRNDLGRCCEPDSVWVKALMTPELCPQVIHLVSTVEGTPAAGLTPSLLIAATLPGGSVTGAPKIRAMEVIEELERVRRGVYTGAIGYFGFDGQADLSVAIRTIVVKDGLARFNVGGGVVADSDSQREYEETILKARGMTAALGASTR